VRECPLEIVEEWFLVPPELAQEPQMFLDLPELDHVVAVRRDGRSDEQRGRALEPGGRTLSGLALGEEIET
jgi:hypothetical protein